VTGVRVAAALLAAMLGGCAVPVVQEVVRPVWVRPDLDAAWLSGAEVRWPPDDGFKTQTAIVLPPGVLLDRFGPDTGRFLSPKGAAFGARALPTACATQPYSVFRVAMPLPAWIGRAAPWFGESGGATQVQTDATVKQLLDDGVLVRLAPTPAPCS